MLLIITIISSKYFDHFCFNVSRSFFIIELMISNIQLSVVCPKLVLGRITSINIIFNSSVDFNVNNFICQFKQVNILLVAILVFVQKYKSSLMILQRLLVILFISSPLAAFMAGVEREFEHNENRDDQFGLIS